MRLDDDSSYNGITGKEAGQLDPGRICFIALDDVRADRSDAEETVIPGKIVRFLEQHANLAFAGTRNRDRVPYGHRVSGWHVSGDAIANSVSLKLTPIPSWTNNRDALDENFFLLPLDGSKSWKFRPRLVASVTAGFHSR